MAAERSGLITFAVVAAAAAGAGLVRARGQALQPDSPARVFDVPSIPAEVARPFSFGMRSLAADLTFLEAIQIHGSRSLKLPEPEARRDDRAMTLLLRYTTDLDEKFAGAYRFTGNALPRHTIDGKVYGVFATEYLLEKGVRERPDDWRISFLLGFIESYYLGKMGEAARHIAHAAQQQGAPGYLGLLATRLAADAGTLDNAEQLARTMAAQAHDEETRAEWEQRILDLRMERDLRRIEEAAARFKQRAGRPAASVEALVRAGDLRRQPQEPHGGSYFLVTETGEARSTAAARLRIRGRAGTMAGLEIH